MTEGLGHRRAGWESGWPRSRILVLGGTGFVGRSLIARLVSHHHAAGLRLLVPSRHPARAKALITLPGVEVTSADVHDDRSLAALVRGCNAVVNLVAILHGDARRFEQVHVQLPRRLAAAMAAAGVRRLVHVSALGVPERGRQPAPSMYLASKSRGEAVLQDAAGANGVLPTILRPSVIFGEQDRFMNLFAGLQAWSPVMPLAGADATFQPVWVEDVAEAIARCLADEATAGSTYECAGPRIYSLAEVVRLAGRWSGHERPVVSLPDAMGRLQASVLSWLPGEPLMSADNLASMRVPNVATGRLPGLQALGIEPAALETVMPVVLSRAEPVLDRWRRGARR